jgi:hypothetical protein
MWWSTAEPGSLAPLGMTNPDNEQVIQLARMGLRNQAMISVPWPFMRVRK